MGIVELFKSLFTSQKMDYPSQNNLLLECQLLSSRVTELENNIKQAAKHQAVTESALAISDSQLVALKNKLKVLLEELRLRKESFELESPVQRLRVAELEKKLVQITQENARNESVLPVKTFELAAGEIKLKELRELGLCKEDLDRRSEQIWKEESEIAERMEYYKKKLEEELTRCVYCKKWLDGRKS